MGPILTAGAAHSLCAGAIYVPLVQLYMCAPVVDSAGGPPFECAGGSPQSINVSLVVYMWISISTCGSFCGSKMNGICTSGPRCYIYTCESYVTRMVHVGPYKTSLGLK